MVVKLNKALSTMDTKTEQGPDVPSDETQIWRYLDLSKFIYLLERQTLFFCRCDLFSDELEGTRSKPLIDEMDQDTWRNLSQSDIDFLPPKMRRVAQREKQAMGNYLNRVFMDKFWDRLRSTWCVNSWHMNEGESAGMWKLYLKCDEGVAVKSSVGALRTAVEVDDDFCGIFKVHYIDYERSEPPNHPWGLAVCKRESYRHENEVRAIVHMPFAPKEEQASGRELPVRLNTLIQKIVLTPGSPKWFADTVKIIVSKWGLDALVCHSELDGKKLRRKG